MLVSSFRNPRDLLCAPSITGKIVIIPTLDESQVKEFKTNRHFEIDNFHYNWSISNV